jgi:hypothetical protein
MLVDEMLFSQAIFASGTGAGRSQIEKVNSYDKQPCVCRGQFNAIGDHRATRSVLSAVIAYIVIERRRNRQLISRTLSSPDPAARSQVRVYPFYIFKVG